MSHRPTSFPSRADGLCLHRRLLDQDPVATADICDAYLEPLLAMLARRFPRIEPHLRETAAHDTLLKYIQRPQLYDPRKADLAVFLRVVAQRKLLHQLNREARHHRRRVGWAAVENGPVAGYLSGRDAEPLRDLVRGEEHERRQALVRAVAERSTPEERQVLDLLLDGEHRHEVYAQALGVGGLPAPEQERAVKRAMDRVKVRLKREGHKHG